MIYKMYSVHYAPKDSHTAIKFYVNAENGTEVYNQVREELILALSIDIVGDLG